MEGSVSTSFSLILHVKVVKMVVLPYCTSYLNCETDSHKNQVSAVCYTSPLMYREHHVNNVTPPGYRHLLYCPRLVGFLLPVLGCNAQRCLSSSSGGRISCLPAIYCYSVWLSL